MEGKRKSNVGCKGSEKNKRKMHRGKRETKKGQTNGSKANEGKCNVISYEEKEREK